MKVEFYRHQLDDSVFESVKDVFGSVFLTTGPVTGRFEESLAAYLGAEYAVGLTSCTAGLFLCLTGWDIGPGDEVLVPAMTFVATANAALHCGAKPVFVDVDDATGLMDLDDAERKVTPRTKAVIPVHLYGQMIDMKRARAFANRHGLKLLEDAAHCMEGSRDGIRPGQLGDAASFSFYATKNITCGEGGAITTNDAALADRVRILRLHGLDRDAAKRYVNFRHYDMIELGYKYNMNDIQAAMLMPQLDTIADMHGARLRLFKDYTDAISKAGIPVTLPTVEPGVDHACHLFVVRTEREKRESLLSHLQSQGVGVAVNYRAVHLNSYYRETLGTAPGMCPRAEAMGEEVLSLPFYPGLSREAVDYVVSAIGRFYSGETS